jgi:iron(II)-dependent oxidoreductase
MTPMPSTLTASTLDRRTLTDWYRLNRARSAALFQMLEDDAYYRQPIALRHPVVFYDGHLHAFSFNTLVKGALGGASIDARLETLFARGIDPEHEDADGAARFEWPDRGVVRQFADEVDRRVIDALTHADLVQPGHPLLDRGEAVFTILEHEAMHQETLLYLWHRLPFSSKRAPQGYSPQLAGQAPHQEWIEVPAGRATLGVDRSAVPFGWDNEFPAHAVEVPAFEIQRHDVTNTAFLEFVDAGGYHEPRWWTPEGFQWVRHEQLEHPAFWERQESAWYWRGMFGSVPLPLAWPVYVSHAEAAAFARWRGHRLPTEAEFQRAAYGTPDGSERRFPWGDFPAEAARGVFDFTSWDPEPAGSRPAGCSAWGIDDLVGNGWEWTGTVFAPFPGFQPMPSYPQYSADFFDGAHFVLKGASTATARALIRPSFRNWFRPHYPYVYATFRCARDVR